MEYDQVVEGIRKKYSVELGDWHCGEKLCFSINATFEIVMERSPFENAFFLSSPIFQLKPSISKEFYRTLLTFNLFGNKTGNGFLSIDPLTETVLLMEKFDEGQCDFSHFDTKLKQFLSTISHLKQKVHRMEFDLTESTQNFNPDVHMKRI
jgi:hypothetical protein